MLEKNDIQAIRAIIREEVPGIIREEVPGMIAQELKPIKQDIKTIKSDITKIRSDINIILATFDREYLELRKRVDRIEEVLSLPPIKS